MIFSLYEHTRLTYSIILFCLVVFTSLWASFADAADSITGSVYLDQGLSVVTSQDQEISVLVNGAYVGTDLIDVAGSYDIDTGLSLNSGDVITAYIDGSTEHGVAVSRTDGPVSGFDVYYDTLILRSDDVAALSEADLSLSHNGDTDIDHIYTIDSDTPTTASDALLYLPFGESVSLASGLVANGSVDLDGILDIGSADVVFRNHVDITGSFLFDGVDLPSVNVDGGSQTIDFKSNETMPDFSVEDNIQLNITSSLDVDGDFSVSGTASVFANSFPIDLEGDFNLLSGSFTAPSTLFDVGGDFVAQGTFVHNSGIVSFDGLNSQNIYGANIFNDFAIAGSGVRTIGFEEDQLQLIEGTFTADLEVGDVAQIRTIDIGGGILNDGSQHTINVDGGFGTIDYLDVRDAILQEGGAVKNPALDPPDSINSGNQDGWITRDRVRGVLYADQGITPITSSDMTIHVLRNGVSIGSDVTDSNGEYLIDLGTAVIDPGDIITAYIDNESVYGLSYTVADGRVDDFDVYVDHVIVRSETSGGISGSQIALGNNGDADITTLHQDQVSPVVFSAGALLVSEDHLFRPEQQLDVDGDIYVFGDIDMAGFSASFAGDVHIAGALFNYPNLVLDGSFASSLFSSVDIQDLVVGGSGNFVTLLSDLVIDDDLLIQGPSNIFDGGSFALDINDDVTIQPGATLIGSSLSTNIGGTFTNAGIFDHGNGHVILDGFAPTVFGSINFYDLTIEESIDDTSNKFVTFESGSSIGIHGTFSASGLDGNDLLMLYSSTQGTQASLVFEPASNFSSAGFLQVRDFVIVDNSASVTLPLEPLHSNNAGNNNGVFGVSVLPVHDGFEGGQDVVFEVLAASQNYSDAPMVFDVTFSGDALPNSDYGASVITASIDQFQRRGLITLPVVDDGLVEDVEDIQVAIASMNSGYDVVDVFATASIVSDDVASLIIGTQDVLLSGIGDSESINISLGAIPDAVVTVTVSANDSRALGVDTASLTFTPANWNIPQNIIVHSRDYDGMGIASFNVLLSTSTSSDPIYAALQSEVVNVDVSYAGENAESISVYRFWSQLFRGHFYTTSVGERDNLIANDPNWEYEGIISEAAHPTESTASPVYRFWSPVYRHHFFTISANERDHVIANDPNWEYEGEAYFAYVDSNSSNRPVFRFYSENFRGHFYTTSVGERDSLIANDPNWAYEGEAWYVPL